MLKKTSLQDSYLISLPFPFNPTTHKLCISTLILHLDVHWSIQADHGLFPECLQWGYVCPGGAVGLSGEGVVQVRAEWPQRLPELGERSGFTAHRFQSGTQLSQEEDNWHTDLTSASRWKIVPVSTAAADSCLPAFSFSSETCSLLWGIHQSCRVYICFLFILSHCLNFM